MPFGPVKAVEDTGSLGFRDSGAVVLDGQLHLVLAGRHAQAHQTAFGRVLDRVARQVVQRLGEAIGIRVQRPSSFACQLEAPIGSGGQALEEVADERLELDVLRVHQRPFVCAGEQEEVVHQALHAHQLDAGDALGATDVLGAGGSLAGEHLELAADDGQRRAQFV